PRGHQGGRRQARSRLQVQRQRDQGGMTMADKQAKAEAPKKDKQAEAQKKDKQAEAQKPEKHAKEEEQKPTGPARLQQHYREKIAPELMAKFGYKSPMQVPRLTKI